MSETDLDAVKAKFAPYRDLGLKKRKNNQCVLPDHQDRNPSFSVFKSDQVWLWKCHGCDRSGSIVDLYIHKFRYDESQAIDAVLDRWGKRGAKRIEQNLPTQDDRPVKKKRPTKIDSDCEIPPLDHVFNRSGHSRCLWASDGQESVGLSFRDATYIDIQPCEYEGLGPRAFAVCRWDDVDFDNCPDKDKVIRPCYFDGDRWRHKVTEDGLLRPLYSFDKIGGFFDVHGHFDSSVVVVEGEKCMHALREAHKSAQNSSDLPTPLITTNIGGASAVNTTDWSPIIDRDVLLLPDNDTAGITWAHKAGIKIEQGDGSVQMIRLYGDDEADKGKDIADWLQEPGNDLAKLYHVLEREDPIQRGMTENRRPWEPNRADPGPESITETATEWLRGVLEEHGNPYREEVLDEVAQMEVEQGEYLLHEMKQVIQDSTGLTKQECNRKWEKSVQERAGKFRAAERSRGESSSTVILSDGTPSHVQIAGRVRKELQSQSGGIAPVYDEQSLWIYQPDEGCWKKHYEKKSYEGPLARSVHELDGLPILDPKTQEETQRMKVSENYTRGVLKTICRESQGNEWRAPFFETAEKGVAFSDHFVYADLPAGELRIVDHDPAHAQRVGLDFPFDTEADSPLFDRYLHSVFEPDDDEEQKITLVKQILGAALFGLATSSVGKRAFMLQGPKGTGKSTLLHLLKALFPEQSISSIPPHSFGDEGKRAGLQGKRLNIVFETPNSKLLRENGFKSIIHGEQIRINKKYIARTDTKPIALHVFACNELPDCPGTTDAFWDRWHGLTFNRQFRNTAEQIPDLEERIIDQELPGVVAHAIQGAKSLLENGGYLWPESSAAMLSEWRNDGEIVQRFFEDCTASHAVAETNKQTWVKASKLWKAWGIYRSEKGHPEIIRETFKSLASDAGYTRGKSGVKRWNCQLTDHWDERVRRQ